MKGNLLLTLLIMLKTKAYRFSVLILNLLFMWRNFLPNWITFKVLPMLSLLHIACIEGFLTGEPKTHLFINTRGRPKYSKFFFIRSPEIHSTNISQLPLLAVVLFEPCRILRLVLQRPGLHNRML